MSILRNSKVQPWSEPKAVTFAQLLVGFDWGIHGVVLGQFGHFRLEILRDLVLLRHVPRLFGYRHRSASIKSDPRNKQLQLVVVEPTWSL